jgi:hypothetical protein
MYFRPMIALFFKSYYFKAASWLVLVRRPQRGPASVVVANRENNSAVGSWVESIGIRGMNVRTGPMGRKLSGACRSGDTENLLRHLVNFTFKM